MPGPNPLTEFHGKVTDAHKSHEGNNIRDANLRHVLRLRVGGGEVKPAHDRVVGPFKSFDTLRLTLSAP